MFYSHATGCGIFRIVLIAALVAATYSACSDPPSLLFAEAQISDIKEPYEAGTNISYSCKIGYKSVSSPTFVICQKNSTWTEIKEFCTPSCLDPPTFKLAEVDEDLDLSKPFPSGTKIVYKCIAGYMLEPSKHSYIKCQDDFTWSQINDFCTKITCGSPGEPANGYVTTTDNLFESTAVYTCNEGYNLIGDNSRVCLSNGSWSGAIPICERAKCGSPGDISNGKVDAPNSYIGSTATFVCNEGVSCGDPENIDSGYVETTDNLFGSTATFFCDAGYKLQGNMVISCLSNGSWSSRSPVCRRSCPDPPRLSFASADIDSNLGYFDVGVIIEYKCNVGYASDIFNTWSITCQKDFTWTQITEFCNKVSCGSPELIENGYVQTTDNLFGSTVDYTCEEGYVMVGTASRVCLANGQWSGSVPICKKTCPEPPTLPFAEIIGLPEDNYYPVGIYITYKCLPGYKLDFFQPSFIRCQTNAAWTEISELCKKIEVTAQPSTVTPTVIETTLWTDVTMTVPSLNLCEKISAAQEDMRKCTSAPDEWAKYLEVQYLYLQIENLKLDLENKKKEG